jgi:hypothetical protein
MVASLTAAIRDAFGTPPGPRAQVGHQATLAEKKAALARYEHLRAQHQRRANAQVAASAKGWPELDGQLPAGYVCRYW